MGKKIHCRGSVGKVNWVMMGTSDWNTDSGREEGAESLAVKCGRGGRSRMGFSLGKCPSAPRRAPEPAGSKSSEPNHSLPLVSQCLLLVSLQKAGSRQEIRPPLIFSLLTLAWVDLKAHVCTE